jgi:hypothetical protein
MTRSIKCLTYIRNVLGVKSYECKRDGWRSNGTLSSTRLLPAIEEGSIGEDEATGLGCRGEDEAAHDEGTGGHWVSIGFVCEVCFTTLTSETADSPNFGGGINRLDGLGGPTDMTRVLLRGDDGASSGMTKGCEYFVVWDSTTCCQCASSSLVESRSICWGDHQTAELCDIREEHTKPIHKYDPFLELGPRLPFDSNRITNIGDWKTWFPFRWLCEHGRSPCRYLDILWVIVRHFSRTFAVLERFRSGIPYFLHWYGFRLANFDVRDTAIDDPGSVIHYLHHSA